MLGDGLGRRPRGSGGGGWWLILGRHRRIVLLLGGQRQLGRAGAGEAPVLAGKKIALANLRRPAIM
jgi:hypothetical protein